MGAVFSEGVMEGLSKEGLVSPNLREAREKGPSVQRPWGRNRLVEERVGLGTARGAGRLG